MDYEKLIERLRHDANAYRNGDTLGRAYADQEDVLDKAVDAMTALLAENKRLKSLLSEGGQDLWSKENQRADRLESENEKLRDEAEGMRSNWYKSVEEIHQLRAENIRWGQVASEQDKQLDRLLAELGQVKHQRDSYRLYHDDLASKPNCNTCADKDCKYRPIPGDTVRANCPLWRGNSSRKVEPEGAGWLTGQS